METAVQVVWWIGLAAALVLTLVAVKLLSELLRTLGHLRELANWIAVAAAGLADAITGPLGLPEAAGAAEGLRSSSMALAVSAARVRGGVDGRHRPEGGPPADSTGGQGAGELGGTAGGPASGGVGE